MSIISAFYAFRSKYKDVEHLEDMKDELGIYAIRFQKGSTKKQAFFCYKVRMGSRLIGIHHSIYEEAKKYNLPIILSLGEKYYYLFTAADIERECKTDWTENGTMMIYFPISSATSLQKPREHKLSTAPKHKKNLKPDGLLELPIGKVMEKDLGPLERVG